MAQYIDPCLFDTIQATTYKITITKQDVLSYVLMMKHLMTSSYHSKIMIE